VQISLGAIRLGEKTRNWGQECPQNPQAGKPAPQRGADIPVLCRKDLESWILGQVHAFAFFVIRLYRGRMTKKDGCFESLPRAAAATQPRPGLSYAALSGLQNGWQRSFLQGNILSTGSGAFPVARRSPASNYTHYPFEAARDSASVKIENGEMY
jgi:hypothetical protein